MLIYLQSMDQLAAEFGTLEVVQYIKDYSSVKGYSLLNLAAYGGKLDIVQNLIKNQKYDMRFKGKRGRTPLNSACAGRQLNVVKYLVDECKAHFTCLCCDNHSTPLDIAA